MIINAGMLAEMLESRKPSTSIESTNKYNGNTMFINAGMLAEMLESIENLQNQLKIQANTWESTGY